MSMASSLHASRVLVSIGLLLAAAGCANHVAVTPGDLPSVGSGGNAAVTAASSSTSGGGEGGTGGGATCVPQDETTGGSTPATCADLAALAVSHAVITEANGNSNGEVNAGEGANLHVSLDEIAGIGFYYYPGVIFESSSDSVTVSADDWFYGISSCATNVVFAHVNIASDVPAGTVVTITARVAMLNHECPDAPSLVIPFTVH
jgi:hypothetical protein